MKRIGLLPRLIIGLLSGIVIGYVSALAGVQWPVRLLATFNTIFGNFLGYIIPFIIIGFVAPGIADLGKSAGKLLGLTTGIAYLSTIGGGTLAIIVGSFLLPGITGGGTAENPEHALLATFVNIEIPAMMGVMTALITAFLLGLGMAAIGSRHMLGFMKEFQEIIEKVIRSVIIPLLPIHIGGIFANMTFAGEVVSIMAVFGQVFAVVIALHFLYLVLMYFIAGSVTGRNPLSLIKNMVPAYVTAIGTQSSAATIPVTMQCARKNEVSEDVASFGVPLCATIHLSGSTITITMCAMGVIFMSGGSPAFGDLFPFVLMLGVTMVAAPGVPGGAVMAALGLLSSMLGFNEAQIALMIGLYLTQDSFGTAANVTGDGAIALIVDRFAKGPEPVQEVQPAAAA